MPLLNRPAHSKATLGDRSPGGDNLVKDVQCYELFGGIAPKNLAFAFSMLLLLYGTLFQMMSGVPHHCHHLSLV